MTVKISKTFLRKFTKKKIILRNTSFETLHTPF